MGDLSPSELERLRRLGERIGVARKAKSLTLVQLADRAKLDEKTVRTAIDGGQVRLSSLSAICKSLDIAVDEDEEKIEISEEKFGSYLLDHYKHYIGYYYAYRRSFSYNTHLLRSAYEIVWCPEKNNAGLKFREVQQYESLNMRKKIDFSQCGDVHISNSTNMIHFITSVKGSLRLVTLTKMQCDDGTENGTLSGIVLTQAKKSVYYQPSTSAIFFQKIDGQLKEEDIAQNVGSVRPEHEEYLYINEYLTEIERTVGIFATSPDKGAPELRVVASQG